MWHTMLRVGAVHALDCADYDPVNQALEVIHRPETRTPLKNGETGERFVALSEDVCEVLDDWIEQQRPAVTDEHGRELLVTTPEGCAHTTPFAATATGTLSRVSRRESARTGAKWRSVQRPTTTALRPTWP